MLATATSFTIDGFRARRVWVEVDVRAGLPAFHVVGLGDKAVREARERVRTAIHNSGFEFPMRRITANLAPAYLRKAGPAFDLALAVGVLAASGQLPAESLAGAAVFGELSLGGELRPARGTLVVAEAARDAGVRALVVARERAGEAALVDGLQVLPVGDLRAAVACLSGDDAPTPATPPPEAAGDPAADDADLADVRGQPEAVRALTIAAAGGHNILLQGPPGTGKTMLARRLPSILPPLSDAEALEVTRIRSLAGLHAGGGLVRMRPFRAPHHGISAAGLVGGGARPTPGEATLAHRGVLFLDELAEFSRLALEALRQPLEDGRVVVVRGQQAVTFPTRVTLVAATNPCPCGATGPGGECRCTDSERERYRRRLSGPLLDRMDLIVTVERPPPGALRGPPGPSSAEVRERVVAARERQRARRDAGGAECNAQLDDRALRRVLRLDGAAEEALATAYAGSALSGRGHSRVLRVARTIADLAGRERVRAGDVHEALYFRDWLTAPVEAAA